MQGGIQAGAYGISPGAGFFFDQDKIEQALTDFDALGFHWIRSNVPWKNFQPDDPRVVGEDASYNWKAVDAFIATMNSPQWDNRFALIVQIGNVPDWAKQNVTPGDGNIPLPFDQPLFAKAAAALAERLYGTVHVFEIQNEPNMGKKGAAHGVDDITDWPVPDAYGYAQLLKLVYPAIHAARPKAVVLIGGLGGTQDVFGVQMASDEFLQGIYAAGGKNYFDGVAFHPYSQPVLPCAANSAVCEPNLHYVSRVKDPYGMTNGWTRMLNARQIMVGAGDAEKQIWITEFGAPTAAVTDDEQAEILTAGVTRASQHDFTRVFCWFTYKDDNNDAGVAGDSMGLIRADGSLKPSYDTYKALLADT